MKEYENLTEAVKGLSLRERASYEDITEAALHLLPENERLPLLRKVLAELPTPVTEDPVSESTGLPQTLRGAIHALTRVHPPNLVVDAAMLEMPEEQRAEVAKAFLPKRVPLRDKLEEIQRQKEAAKAAMYVVVDVDSGEELGLIASVAARIRILDGKTGQPVSYEHVRTEREYDFREDEAVKPRKLALYRKVTAG
jgi:hypothetical protein